MKFFSFRKKKSQSAPPSSEPAIPEPNQTNNALKTLRAQISRLDKREQFLESKIKNMADQARKFAATKNKRQALVCLKRKKMYQTQIETIYGARATLEQQELTIESASFTADVFSSMKHASNHLTEMQSALTINDVDDVIDNTQEAIQLNNEVGDTLAAPMGNMMNDDDLAAELENIETQMLEEELLAEPKIDLSKLPVAPKSPVAAPRAPTVTTEQQELDELEAMMA